ncbi:MAG: hypothetical protein H6Q70_385 [Firmicutes bacterium]|nr:hypothetical protein [Bacillota bacterium]
MKGKYMNKKKIVCILKYFFIGILGVIATHIIGYAFLINLILSPYDFELDITGVLSDHFMHTDLDNDITAYKTVHTMLYVRGESGFWVINLKKKEFRLLNTEIDDTDLMNINRMDCFDKKIGKNDKIYSSINSKKKKYGDRLIVLNHLEQLSDNERQIYDELKTGQGEGVKVLVPHRNTRGGITDMKEQWGPYQQPLEYLFN